MQIETAFDDAMAEADAQKSYTRKRKDSSNLGSDLLKKRVYFRNPHAIILCDVVIGLALC